MHAANRAGVNPVRATSWVFAMVAHELNRKCLLQNCRDACIRLETNVVVCIAKRATLLLSARHEHDYTHRDCTEARPHGYVDSFFFFNV